MAEDSKTEWRNILLEVLGKESEDCIDELIILLTAVDQSVKPSFRWDFDEVSPQSLLSVIQTLYSKDFLKCCLSIIEVGDDIFIVNLDAVTRILISYLSSEHTWLIDISKSDAKIACPTLHTKYKAYICSILQQLGIVSNSNSSSSQSLGSEDENNPTTGVNSPQNSQPLATKSNADSQCFSLSFSDDVNLSTIFSLLLGLPQNYWWNCQSDELSISGLSLKKLRFTAQFTKEHSETDDTADVSEEFEVFSFSVPETLEPELKPSIQQWANIVYTRIEQAANFAEARLNSDSVLCLQHSS